ncbi:MAG: putative Ig domain-containing protein, partial [Porticoccaceae bacterium]
MAVVVMAGCNGSENSNQSDTSSSSEIDSPSLHSLEESNGDMAQTIVTSFSESPDKLDTATEVRVRLNTKTTINNNAPEITSTAVSSVSESPDKLETATEVRVGLNNKNTINNNAPEITSTAIDTVNENDSYSYTVITNDVDEGDEVSLTVTFNDPSAENWLHFNPANGVLFGTPSNNDVGAYDVAITATDDSKATDTQSFTITVVDVNHAPTAQDQMFMVSPKIGSNWVDGVLDSTDFSFNDVDGDPIKEIKITEPSNGAIFSQQAKKNEYPLTVPVSELPSLKFKLVTTNLDDSQVFYVEFEFQVSDGELYSETQTMKIVDLKSAVDECLKDSSNGDCRIFLDNSQNLSEWDTSKVTDM